MMPPPTTTKSSDGHRIPRVAVIIIVVILSLPALGIGFVIGFDYLTYRRIRSLFSGRSNSVPVSMKVFWGQRSLLVTDPSLLHKIASAGASPQSDYAPRAHETITAFYTTTFDFGSGSTYPVSMSVHSDGRGLCFVVGRGPGLEALKVFSDPYYYDMRLDCDDDSNVSEMMRFLLNARTPGSLHIRADVPK